MKKKLEKDSLEFNSYDSSDIEVLGDIEAVRKRPAMFIGSTEKKGVFHLLSELLDNSTDEVLAGFCSYIKVTLTKKGEAIVFDKGRGIPIGVHSVTNKSAVETIFTTLHAGGKFSSRTYKVSGGLHGVGASVVNALSEYLEVTTSRERKTYSQVFFKGVPESKKLVNIQTPPEGSWTEVKFKPDAEIFEEGISFDRELIRDRLNELAFLNRGLVIDFLDEENDSRERFFYRGGIKEFLEKYVKNQDIELVGDLITIRGQMGLNSVEICLQYAKNFTGSSIFSFCNNVRTWEGGSHETTIFFSLLSVINRYINEAKLLGFKEKLTFSDVKQSLVLVVSVLVSSPQFEGQTKRRVRSVVASKMITKFFNSALESYLLKNSLQAGKIVDIIFSQARRRISILELKDLQSKVSSTLKMDIFQLPGKLASATIKSPLVSELFIVEGDSAGGTAKMARDRSFQAVLPIRGKILNCERVFPKSKTLLNKEISDVVSVIGTGIAEKFSMEKLRYNKIIILADADLDGDHIKVLLITLFMNLFPEIVKQKKLFVSFPPLYSVPLKKKVDGRRVHFFFSDQELEEFFQKNDLIRSKASIRRFKGLGEMNPEQLRQTAMSPATRRLVCLTVDDKAFATLANLMGKNIETRRSYSFGNSGIALETETEFEKRSESVKQGERI